MFYSLLDHLALTRPSLYCVCVCVYVDNMFTPCGASVLYDYPSVFDSGSAYHISESSGQPTLFRGNTVNRTKNS